jgi:glycosyltransferase involved in cell wall biosynthesis
VDVELAGGSAVVLPDRLQDININEATRNVVELQDERPTVVIVSTFAPDEPTALVLEAASKMPHVHFFITGKKEHFFGLGLALPTNVELTGFVPDEEYWRLLASAQIVCDLTLMPDCLVCGAYEGLALARPMVLSDNPATRELFSGAAIFAPATVDGIAESWRQALEKQSELERGAKTARVRFQKTWNIQSRTVWQSLEYATRRRRHRCVIKN